MIVFFFIIVFLLLGLIGYLLWMLHQRMENLIDAHNKLDQKISEGEKAIIENFEIIENRYLKIEHEIKEIKRGDPKAKATFKAVTRLQREQDRTNS